MLHLARILAVSSVVAVAAMGQASITPASAADVIKLGHIIVTSGPLKAPGEPSIAAVDIAVAEINAAGGIAGKQVQLIKYDTASDPKQASVAVRKLAEDDGVLAIIGPFSSGEAGVAFNDAERLGVVIMPNAASSPGLTKDKKWAFRLTEDEDVQFRRLLQTLKKKGVKASSAAILYVSEEAVANFAGTKLYPALFKEAGITNSDPVAIQYKSFDIAPQVSKVVKDNPDLIAVAGLPESASKILRELTRQGYKGKMIGSQLFADPNVIELFGKEAEGTTFVAGFWRGRTEKSEAFTVKFMAENQKRGIRRLGAHHSDAQSYDTVYLLKQMMEKAKVTADPAKLKDERVAIRDAFAGVKFTGILGDNICFVGHDAELPGYIIEIKDGQWTKYDEWPGNSCP